MRFKNQPGILFTRNSLLQSSDPSLSLSPKTSEEILSVVGGVFTTGNIPLGILEDCFLYVDLAQ